MFLSESTLVQKLTRQILAFRRSATGHRASEGSLLRHGSAPDSLELQANVEALEAEIVSLQHKLQSASHDRTAELEHVQQMNTALKAEIAAMQSSMSGIKPQQRASTSPSRPPVPLHPAVRDNINLESFGSCLLLEALQPGEDEDFAEQQQPYPMHHLAPIMEVDSNLSHRTTTAEEAEQLLPGLQNQVHALATSLQVKTSEAEALQQMVEHLENKVGQQVLVTHSAAICVH